MHALTQNCKMHASEKNPDNTILEHVSFRTTPAVVGDNSQRILALPVGMDVGVWVWGGEKI